MLAFVNDYHTSKQITKHWSHNLKAEMNLDKLQLVATAAISSAVKIQWFSWWNSSTLQREALRFPKNPFSDKEFEAWLNKVSFWVGVRLSLYYAAFLHYESTCSHQGSHTTPSATTPPPRGWWCNCCHHGNEAGLLG